MRMRIIKKEQDENEIWVKRKQPKKMRMRIIKKNRMRMKWEKMRMRIIKKEQDEIEISKKWEWD